MKHSDKSNRAVRLSAFGPPHVLEHIELPPPIPQQGEVVVEVEYAGVTFVETQMRAGRAPFPVELPIVLGNGVAGTIVEVGPEVEPDVIGRRVVTTTGGSGGYAAMVAVAAGAPIEVPPVTPLDVAAALLADGRTALYLFDAAGVGAGDRIVVEAAAGGVGSLLVQLAIGAGAQVVGLAGGGRKTGVVEGLGVARAVDYRCPGWPKEVREELVNADVVFDGVGGEVARATFELLSPGGRMLSYGLASGAWSDITAQEAEARGVKLLEGTPLTPEASRLLSVQALDLAARGRLSPVIGQRYPLEEAAEAHAAIEGRRTVGKTLLMP